MQRRSDDIKNGYHVKFTDDSLLLIGDQMDYEMQEDFVAMLFAIERMGKFLLFSREDKNKRPYDSQIEMAYKDLLNRVSKYSCPNMLKNHANCPLTNDGCFMNGCSKLKDVANELRLKLQLMEAEYKRLGSEILLIEKQMDDLSTQMKPLIDNSQLIAEALLEDEYNALVRHGI